MLYSMKFYVWSEDEQLQNAISIAKKCTFMDRVDVLVTNGYVQVVEFLGDYDGLCAVKEIIKNHVDVLTEIKEVA